MEKATHDGVTARSAEQTAAGDVRTLERRRDRLQADLRKAASIANLIQRRARQVEIDVELDRVRHSIAVAKRLTGGRLGR